MTTFRHILLLVAFLIAPTALVAECERGNAYIYDLLVLSCTQVEEVAAARREAKSWNVDDVDRYLGEILRRSPGVVLDVRVSRSREAEPPHYTAENQYQYEVGSWIAVSYAGIHFFPSSEADPCERFERQPRDILLLEYPCCDVLPPVEPACLLKVGILAELPQWALEAPDDSDGWLYYLGGRKELSHLCSELPNTHECAQAIERHMLEQSGAEARRKGNELTVVPRNGDCPRSSVVRIFVVESFTL